MKKEQLDDVEYFLTLIADLESEVERLLNKAALTEEEKTFILDHIVVVPGKSDRHLKAAGSL